MTRVRERGRASGVKEGHERMTSETDRVYWGLTVLPCLGGASQTLETSSVDTGCSERDLFVSNQNRANVQREVTVTVMVKYEGMSFPKSILEI